MQKLIIRMLCVLSATSGILLAQDGKDLEKIRTLRASLLVKLPLMNDAFDHEHNGVNVAAADLMKRYQDAVAAVNKKIEEEDAKPADVRDKVATDALRGRMARIQAMWSDRATKTAPAWSKKFAELSIVRLNLNTVITDLTALDPSWVRAECDRALFVQILTELNKRADDVKDQGTALVAEWLKRTEDDIRATQD